MKKFKFRKVFSSVMLGAYSILRPKHVPKKKECNVYVNFKHSWWKEIDNAIRINPFRVLHILFQKLDHEQQLLQLIEWNTSDIEFKNMQKAVILGLAFVKNIKEIEAPLAEKDESVYRVTYEII